jgi:hypothetical protein
MDSMVRTKLKAQIAAMSASNNAFKAMMGITPMPVVAGIPPLPIVLQPVLAPYLAALQMHADEFAKLLKVCEEIIDKS